MIESKKARVVKFASERSDSTLNLASAGIASERSVHVELRHDQKEECLVVLEISTLCSFAS